MSSSYPLTILYGSATGNAEGIAKDLAETLTANNHAKLPAPFDSVVCKELDQFRKVGVGKAWASPPPLPAPKSSSSSSSAAAAGDYTCHSRHGLIVITSTTGNGDPPENAGRFVRFLKKQAASSGASANDFQHVAYAVLGLGDTNYDQFCAMGKLLDKKLQELGGFKAKPLACADEATGLEDVVEPWLETVVADVGRACMTNGAAAGGVEEHTKAEEETPAVVEEAAPVATAAAAVTPSASIPEQSDAPLYILYGSATGNAEQIAKDLSASYETMIQNPDVKTFWRSVVCAELGQFKKLKLLEAWDGPACPLYPGVQHGVLVIASTTGNGDAPENAERFMRHVKKAVKDLQPQVGGKGSSADGLPFRNVCFSVLVLGDTNYDQFCNTGKNLDKKFQELGGTRAKPLACADEATGLEDVVDAWTSSILMEMTVACRGGTCSASKGDIDNTVLAVAPALEGNDMDAQEEKKMDAGDLPLSADYPSSLSPGVAMVYSLLGMDAGTPLAKVEKSCMPQPLSIRVKCDRFEPTQSTEAETLSEDATDDDSIEGPYYTLARPFESSIVSARYLTRTSTNGAVQICETTLGNNDDRSCEATNLLDKHFPLDESCSKAEAELNGKRVIEMTLVLPDDDSFEYQPGDSVGLVVTNTPSAVSFVLDMLNKNHGLVSSQIITVDAGPPTTVGDAVREKMDLCSVVKNRKILMSLSQFATDPREAAVLELLASKTEQGRKLFETFVDEQRRSIVDLLVAFPSCQLISLEALLSILPPIAPRYYSVSSSPLQSSKESPCLTVAFSVVDYLTPSLKHVNTGEEFGCRRIHGHATSYLESLCSPFLASTAGASSVPPGSLMIFPKPTQDFRMPSSLDTPLIMVGPGTGIAPFMGFLAHRRALKEKRAGQDAGTVDVFFGCRHAEHDWLYKDEMQALVAEGVITNLHTAFSRDGNEHKYVQNAMKDGATCREQIVDTILHKIGRVYICGDGNNMAKDVQQAVAEILSPHVEGGDGKAYVETMKSEGRLLLDIWS